MKQVINIAALAGTVFLLVATLKAILPGSPLWLFLVLGVVMGAGYGGVVE